MKGNRQIQKKHGSAHGKKVKQQGIVAVATPHRDGGPGHGDEENGIEQAEFGRDKAKGILVEVFPVPLAVRAGILRDVLNGYPAMLMIPEQNWQRENGVDEQSQVWAGSSQTFPGWRPQDEKNDPGQQLIAEFTQKSQAHPQTGPQPISDGSIGLNRFPAGHHGCGPEQNGKWVDGHQDCACGEKRGRGRNQKEKESSARVDVLRKETQDDDAQQKDAN